MFRGKDVLLEWGIPAVIFLDDERIGMGSYLSYNKIRKLISNKVKKL